MAIVSDEGLVISTSDYRETSLIARCFTKEYGKLSIVAKGIRRPKSRIGASLETFAHLKFVFYLKPGANIATLKEAEALDYFSNLRTDLKRFATASFFFEILDRGLPDLQKNHRIFSLAIEFLKFINATPNAPESALFYLLPLVATLGFAPRLERCALCGSPWRLAFFDPAEGQCICERCGAKRGGLISLPEELRAKMVEVLIGEMRSIGEEIQSGEVRAFLKIIKSLVEYHFDMRLKSSKFLLEEFGGGC